MSQSEDVDDPISVALARRRVEVEHQQALALETCRRKKDLAKRLGQDASLDPGYLVWLLRATWERLPDDLTLTGWESPTTDDDLEQIEEVIAIGAKVADVFAVYNEQEPAMVVGREAGA